MQERGERKTNPTTTEAIALAETISGVAALTFASLLLNEGNFVGVLPGLIGLGIAIDGVHRLTNGFVSNRYDKFL